MLWSCQTKEILSADQAGATFRSLLKEEYEIVSTGGSYQMSNLLPGPLFIYATSSFLATTHSLLHPTAIHLPLALFLNYQTAVKMMRTIGLFISLIMGLVLCACTTDKEPGGVDDQLMDAFIGHPQSDLIAKWGPPTRTVADEDGGSILIYEVTDSD